MKTRRWIKQLTLKKLQFLILTRWLRMKKKDDNAPTDVVEDVEEKLNIIKIQE